MERYVEEFRVRSFTAALQSSIAALSLLILLGYLHSTCPGTIQNWLDPKINTADTSTLSSWFAFTSVAAVVFAQTIILSTSFSKRRHGKTSGLAGKINKTTGTVMITTWIAFYFFTVPSLRWTLYNKERGTTSVNEINVIILCYALLFGHDMIRLCSLNKIKILEHGVQDSNPSISVTRRLLCVPVIKGVRCGVKSLVTVYCMYAVAPWVGTWVRMVVNSVMLKADEQHLPVSLMNLFGFWPIVVILGSRLLCVSMVWSIILEISIQLIQVNQLAINRKTGINLTNKSLSSQNEFESTLAKSELLHLLDAQKDMKSTLFKVSGTPKQPKLWNEIVGTTIANVDAFIDKRLTKPKVASPTDSAVNKLTSAHGDTVTATATVQSHDIDVKIWSDNRRRIVGSSLIAPEAKKGYIAETPNTGPKQGTKAAPKGTKEMVKGRVEKVATDFSNVVIRTGRKLHREFDSLLGIDVYDKMADESRNGQDSEHTSLYSVCQDIQILGNMAVAMSMYDINTCVSFQSRYPIYKIVECLFKLLSAIENVDLDHAQGNTDADQLGKTLNSDQKRTSSLPLHGLDTLRDNIAAAVVKILQAFGTNNLESDFKRVELRPYRQQYLDLIGN